MVSSSRQWSLVVASGLQWSLLVSTGLQWSLFVSIGLCCLATRPEVGHVSVEVASGVAVRGDCGVAGEGCPGIPQ